MSIRATSFVQGEIYHIYNRGNSKQIIFNDKEDMERFLNLLFIANKTEKFCIRSITEEKHLPIYNSSKEIKLVAIGAYCLMPNHFHILITQVTENGISKFMQKLSTAYAMYYNKKYKRTGVLFEGKFKSKHINNDRYLKYLFSYIHLNPIKIIEPKWKEKGIQNLVKARSYLRNYNYSSYTDFLHYGNNTHKREESIILNIKPFPKYFPTQNTFEREIISWLSFKNTL